VIIITITRLFLYGLLESAVIEDLAEPLRFIEQMADVLLSGMTKQKDSI